MRRVARWLMLLYPAAWRGRYGTEFQALLEDVPPGWHTNFDLLKGVIRMQLSMPSFTKLALSLGTAGMGIGYAVSLAMPSQYISEATLQFQAAGATAATPQIQVERIVEMQGRIMSRISLANVINSPSLALYRPELNSGTMEEVIAQMRRNLQVIVATREGGVFNIKFKYRDAQKAALTVAALVTQFLEESQRLADAPHSQLRGNLEQRIAQLDARLARLEKHSSPVAAPAILEPPALGGATGLSSFPQPVSAAPASPILEVVDPPSVPVHPVSPNRGLVTLMGLTAGILAALLIAIFRRPARRVTPLPA